MHQGVIEIADRLVRPGVHEPEASALAGQAGSVLQAKPVRIPEVPDVALRLGLGRHAQRHGRLDNAVVANLWEHSGRDAVQVRNHQVEQVRPARGAADSLRRQKVGCEARHGGALPRLPMGVLQPPHGVNVQIPHQEDADAGLGVRLPLRLQRRDGVGLPRRWWAVPAAERDRPLLRVDDAPDALRHCGQLGERDAGRQVLPSVDTDSSPGSTILSVAASDCTVALQWNLPHALVEARLVQGHDRGFGLLEAEAGCQLCIVRQPPADVAVPDGEVVRAPLHRY